MSKGAVNARSAVLQGTLDLIILQTLHAIGLQHGCGRGDDDREFNPEAAARRPFDNTAGLREERRAL